MLLTLLLITLLLHAVLTGGSIMVWRTLKASAPELLPKAFFVTAIVRMVASLGVFAVAVYIIHEDRETLKQFTLIFLTVYMLLLVFDTVYFYCSSRRK